MSFLVGFHLKYGLARKFYKFVLGNCGGNLTALFVTLQHSLPYSRTDFTLLLYNLIFVFRLYSQCKKDLRNAAKHIKLETTCRCWGHSNPAGW
jgi:hypothetical protein